MWHHEAVLVVAGDDVETILPDCFAPPPPKTTPKIPPTDVNFSHVGRFHQFTRGHTTPSLMTYCGGHILWHFDRRAYCSDGYLYQDTGLEGLCHFVAPENENGVGLNSG